VGGIVLPNRSDPGNIAATLERRVQDAVSLEDIARRIAAETRGFTGGPVHMFGEMGLYTLDSLKQNGLDKNSFVLDLGCGALRLGYWLVRYLDADRYFGIEPQSVCVEAGLRHAIGPEIAAEKRPRFDHGGEFDFSVFGVKFDFVVARSVFSHASPRMIRCALESFRDNSSDDGLMLASYKQIQRGDEGVDVVDISGVGNEWDWRRYRPTYLHEMARECGLWADDYDKKFNGQIWLRVSRKPLT
jgi:SAM-dependent methyltransferase